MSPPIPSPEYEDHRRAMQDDIGYAKARMEKELMGDMAIEMGRAQMAGPRGDSRYAELIQRINMCQDETNQVITNLANKLELVRDLQEKSEGQAIPVAPDNPNRCALDSSLDDIYRETARIRRRLGVLLDEIMI